MTYRNFTLVIKMGNDAMQTLDDASAALFKVAAKVGAGQSEGVIRDDNGNTVGKWRTSGSGGGGGGGRGRY